LPTESFFREAFVEFFLGLNNVTNTGAEGSSHEFGRVKVFSLEGIGSFRWAVRSAAETISALVRQRTAFGTFVSGSEIAAFRHLTLAPPRIYQGLVFP
jgi:hypothetical protein